jgi:hypothetical protein
MRERRRARIGIHRRAVSNDQQSTVFIEIHPKLENVQRATLNVQRSIQKAFQGAASQPQSRRATGFSLNTEKFDVERWPLAS